MYINISVYLHVILCVFVCLYLCLCRIDVQDSVSWIQKKRLYDFINTETKILQSSNVSAIWRSTCRPTGTIVV